MLHYWRQPTRLLCPWDSPGKNTGLGCHFLVQCVKVKIESEVTQSCPTLSDPIDCSLPGSSVHGIFPGKSTGVGCHFLLQCLKNVTSFQYAHNWRLYIIIIILSWNLEDQTDLEPAFLTENNQQNKCLLYHFIQNIYKTSFSLTITPDWFYIWISSYIHIVSVSLCRHLNSLFNLGGYF